MYQQLVKQQIRQGFQQMSRGDFEAVLRIFAPEVHFTFSGDHALGANLTSRERVREWFARVHRIFPNLKIEPRRIFVAGLPWDMTATTEFQVSDTLPDGTVYQNQGVQVVRIRFGKIVEDHLIEDTLRLHHILQRAAELGNQEAGKPPLAAGG